MAVTDVAMLATPKQYSVYQIHTDGIAIGDLLCRLAVLVGAFVAFFSVYRQPDNTSGDRCNANSFDRVIVIYTDRLGRQRSPYAATINRDACCSVY